MLIYTIVILGFGPASLWFEFEFEFEFELE